MTISADSTACSSRRLLLGVARCLSPHRRRLLLPSLPYRLRAPKLSFLRRRRPLSVAAPPSLAAPPGALSAACASALFFAAASPVVCRRPAVACCSLRCHLGCVRTCSRSCGGVARCLSPPRRRLLLLPEPCRLRAHKLSFLRRRRPLSVAAPPSLAAPPRALLAACAQALVLAAASPVVCRRPAVACCSSPCPFGCVRISSLFCGGVARCLSPPRRRLLLTPVPCRLRAHMPSFLRRRRPLSDAAPPSLAAPPRALSAACAHALVLAAASGDD
jgi:hypothetical protein